MEQFLKLREGFFKDETIREIESLPDGETIVYIYIRLMVLAADSNGILSYQRYENYYRKLSHEIKIADDKIKQAIDVLKDYGLVKESEDIAYCATLIRFPYVADNKGIETNLFRRKGK